jgi:hypothetical protein
VHPEVVHMTCIHSHLDYEFVISFSFQMKLVVFDTNMLFLQTMRNMGKFSVLDLNTSMTISHCRPVIMD